MPVVASLDQQMSQVPWVLRETVGRTVPMKPGTRVANPVKGGSIG